MQFKAALLTLLLVASVASAAPSQSEASSNSVAQSQQQAANANQQQQAQASGSVVSNSPVDPSAVSSSGVQVGSQVQPVVVSSGVEQAQQQQPSIVSHVQHHHQQQPQVSSYYHAPAGLINVVGVEQQQGVGNGKQVRNYASEQYGQPEPASLPPNYKPFGSWGLYIGGNPADGYYTNYYKALTNSVEKQVSGVEAPAAVKPSGPAGGVVAPAVRQAVTGSGYSPSSPYVGGDYYPFAYSPSELNTGAIHVPAAQVSPVQAGAQVYGPPASFESNYPQPAGAVVSAYADSYATKKLGAAYAQKEVSAPSKGEPAPVAPKGYQSRVYVYPPIGHMSAPVVGVQAAGSGAQVSHGQQQQQQHVVAYPVPVGSQIVGSQQGVDGAFAPYGVHAFTRYAVKPTVVSSEPSYYYYGSNGQPAQQQQFAGVQPVSSYKHMGASYNHHHHHQQVSNSPVAVPVGSSSSAYSSNYPLGFYGYPLSQLHYSQGSIIPSAQVGEFHHGPVQPVEVMSEKVEGEDKASIVNKQQKRA